MMMNGEGARRDVTIGKYNLVIKNNKTKNVRFCFHDCNQVVLFAEWTKIHTTRTQPKADTVSVTDQELKATSQTDTRNRTERSVVTRNRLTWWLFDLDPPRPETDGARSCAVEILV